jgi:hypothetical protein
MKHLDDTGWTWLVFNGLKGGSRGLFQLSSWHSPEHRTIKYFKHVRAVIRVSGPNQIHCAFYCARPGLRTWTADQRLARLGGWPTYNGDWPCRLACLQWVDLIQSLPFHIIIRNWEVALGVSYRTLLQSNTSIIHIQSPCVGLVWIMTCKAIIRFSPLAVVKVTRETLYFNTSSCIVHIKWNYIFVSVIMKLYIPS